MTIGTPALLRGRHGERRDRERDGEGDESDASVHENAPCGQSMILEECARKLNPPGV
jgi:hypothetical protein